MRKFIRKWQSRFGYAWFALKGGHELDWRALSFACATLEHLEASQEWGVDTCRVLADEAIRRRLGAVEDGCFARTTDAVVLAMRTPLSR